MENSKKSIAARVLLIIVGKDEMGRRIIRLMSYVCVPFTFTAVAYGVLYLVAAPTLQIVYNIGSMVMSQEVLEFDFDMDNIFEMPDFSKEKQPEFILETEIVRPKHGQQYGELACETIGLKAPVYYGDNAGILQAGAGQYIGSFLPGHGRLIVLNAYYTTYFKPLSSVKNEDVFEFTTSYGRYRYEVTEIRTEENGDRLEYDLLAEEEQLVLCAVDPFGDQAGSKSYRVFVYARKVSGPNIRSQ